MLSRVNILEHLNTMDNSLDQKKQEIAAEPVSPIGAKGRLVVPSRIPKLSKKQKERNRESAALLRAQLKLGNEEFNKVQTL